MKINGVITKILTQKENYWGRYEINALEKKCLAVGIIPEGVVGMRVELEGELEQSQYGKQFKIAKVCDSVLDKFAGIRRFLINYMKYLGPIKGNLIVDKFGKDSLSLFETEGGLKKLCTVRGVGDKIARQAQKSYFDNLKYRDLVVFLGNFGTVNQIETIVQRYGDKAEKMLKENPYRLITDFKGFGFKKADQIAQGVGFKKDSPFRITAAASYALEQASVLGGHCFLPFEDLKKAVLDVLVTPPKCEDLSDRVIANALSDWTPEHKESLIKRYNPSAESVRSIVETVETRSIIETGLSEAITNAIKDGYLVNVAGNIYTKDMYETELYVADALKALNGNAPVRKITQAVIENTIRTVEARKTAELKAAGKDYEFVVSDEQRKAVYLAASNRVCIISGGPGRGKTAITEIVAKSFLESGNPDESNIIMLAPTGRAAQRIKESSGYEAYTVHRMVSRIEKGMEEKPKNKLVVCDETSMVDIHLMSKIMENFDENNIVFIGDVDQIASVGPGKVLKDMIDSQTIPCILLKEGHRNSGSIANNADLINAGVKLANYEYDEHFIYRPAPISKLADLVVADYKAKVAQYGIKDVMLCTAMKDRGEVCVNKLNARIQKELSNGQPGITRNGKTFYPGDRVMQTRNNYNFVTYKKKQPIFDGVFNGDRGVVCRVGINEEEATYVDVLFDDGRAGRYLNDEIDDLVLAYVTTIHKCQGSEAKCMMLCYTFGDYLLLNRSLYYTGETRAQEEFRFYGEEKAWYGDKVVSAFDVAVGKVDDSHRNTSLKMLLAG